MSNEAVPGSHEDFDADKLTAIVADTSVLPEGQDSIVIGATSLMFHERLSTLEKFLKLNLPLTSQSLDQNLFLAESPPPDLDYKLAAFIWWTSVDPAYRR